MKLSWFTPLPPAHTEIGNVSARMLPALASAFDLEVYSENHDWDRALGSVCPVLDLDAASLDWRRLNLHGWPVYHIGNNIHFHGEIIQAARRCPGIVVLHDLALHETLLNLCLRKGGGRAAYFEILLRHGGEEAVEVGKAFLDERKIDTNELSVRFPLFEHVVENAAGVITHNPLNAAHIRGCTGAPVLYAPLPFLEGDQMAAPILREPRPPDDPYRILIFGFLGGSNRRLRPFLEALAKCSRRDRFTVTLAGKYPEKEVRQWVRELGLEPRTRLRGFIDDEELDRLLTEADLVPNLRWPSRGESSGTLLRIWNFSLPALVTDTAFYSTLPRDCVAFVDAHREEADLIRHLEAFASDPRPYFAQGQAGRRFLAERHSASAFVASLRDFLPAVRDWQGALYPQLMGRRLVRRYLADYPVPAARPALATRCATELAAWAQPSGAAEASQGRSAAFQGA